MASIEELLGALQATQQQKSSSKLSERNVVELINKLKQLGILGDDLLYTINGKEYITTDQLRLDIKKALAQAGGRLALSELPALVGVDLVHCERQAAALVKESGGSVIEAQGELVTTQYFDETGREINDMLQGSGALSVADLAVQYALSTELLLSFISARLGSIIAGHLDAGLLHTPAYMRNIKAQLRGAMRGASSPTTLPALLKAVGLDGNSLVTSGGVVNGLAEELVACGAAAGTLKASGGATWTPAAYVSAQQDSLRAFYDQNGWIGYGMARKMGVSNERAHLRSAFPDGLALDSVYVSPGRLLAQVEVAVEEAAAGGGWVDAAPLLPSVLSEADVEALLKKVPLVAATTSASAPAATAAAAPPTGVLLLASTCAVSAALLAEAQSKAEAEARKAADKAIKERKGSGAAAATSVTSATGAAASAKATAAAAAGDSDDEDWSLGKKGGGKKGGKGGGGGGGGKKKAAAAAPAKGGKDAAAKDDGGPLSAAALAAQVAGWYPDMDGAGGGEGGLAAAVAERLRPAAVLAYESALTAALTAGAEERRLVKDALARDAEGAYRRLVLHGHGAEAFADDEALHATLQRHAVKSAGAEAVELLLRWCRLQYVLQEEVAKAQQALASSAERSAVLRQLPPDVAKAVSSAHDAVNAKDATCAAVASAFEAAAADCGIPLRKVDKKLEKELLAEHKAQLGDALAAEASPAGALALALPLLLLKTTSRLVSLPGKAMSGALAKLKGGVPDELHGGLEEFLRLVVEQLRAASGDASAGDADELLHALREKLPGLKDAIKKL